MEHNVKLYDKIMIVKRHAVVAKLYDDQPNVVEVVYLDGAKAINEDAQRVENHREFLLEGIHGGYADRNSDLREAVRILRGK